MKPETLLRLYPRRWRERYGDEFLALLRREGTGARVTLNVMAGAFDAWVSRGRPVQVAVRAPIGPRVFWLETDTKAGRYGPEWWQSFAAAVVSGLVVHGIGQLIHPGRMFPISFLAGFMAVLQLWVFRQFPIRTRVAAVVWMFGFMTAVPWLIHYSMHAYVYPLFG